MGEGRGARPSGPGASKATRCLDLGKSSLFFLCDLCGFARVNLVAANLVGLSLIVTPHVAWASVQSRQRLLKEVAENIRAFGLGEARNWVV